MRSTPFALIFEPIAQQSFPKIQATAVERGIDPLDRDAFLLIPDVVTVLRQLRPEEGVGEAMDQLAALLQHAYLAWEVGNITVGIGDEQLGELVSGAGRPQVSSTASAGAPRAYYAQLPERRIWAHAVPGEAAEPMDGCFVHQAPDGSLRVLGIFGFRPERMGFSVVEAVGARPEGLTRPDSSPLFAPTLPGGAAAGVYSLAGAEELLELGWRTRALLAEPVEAR
jgi:hypothetical protein